MIVRSDGRGLPLADLPVSAAFLQESLRYRTVMDSESLGAKGLLCEEELYSECLSLFNFEPGQYGRSMEIDPVVELLFRR